MKICLLTTSYPRFRGDTRGVFIYKLVKALDQYTEVKVVTIKKFKHLTSNAGILPNIRNSFFALISFPLYWLCFYIKIVLNAHNYDIIHANWMPTAFLAILSKPIHRKSIILTERSPFLVSTNNILWKILNKFVFTRVDSLITISNDSKYKISKKYGIKNIKVIKNGIDTPPHKNKQKLRKTLKLPLDKNIILFAGRLTKVKGLLYLMDAFRKISKNHNALLILIGEGEQEEELRTIITKHGLTDIVIFTGRINHKDVIDYMLAADIFVLPSLDETGGNVLLEASACSLPIITTKVGWAQEIIQNGYNGFFIKKRSSSDITSKLSLLLKIVHTSKFNSKKISYAPSWDDCAKNYISEYNRLLSK